MPGRCRTRSSFPLLSAGLLTTLLAAAGSGVVAQSSATVRTEENFRREPNGVVLAQLNAGTPLAVVDRQDNWLEVEVEGWVWLASLQASDQEELDLVVSASGGENLRRAPSGDILGKLEEGALLEDLGRQPGWAHVRRRGWIWAASVNQSEVAQAVASGATPSAQPAPSSTAAAARRPSGVATVGAGGVPIVTAPDGDTLAQAVPGSDLQIVSRDGNWARVRLEGWIWMPEAEQGSDSVDETTSVLTPDDLARDPSAYGGRVVSWELQFISRERAEAIRTEFREGEPFLLTRYGGPEGAFVYVAVPPDRADDVQGLVPLERISVTARVRTGASSLTGAPIIDLLSVEKSR